MHDYQPQYDEEFTFDTYSEEEIDKIELLEAGKYDFVVSKVKPKVSKSSGNKMLEIQLQVFDKSGNTKTVFDYLVFTPGGAKKMRHFFESINKIDLYEQKKASASALEGLNGMLDLIIQKQETGEYAGTKKNAVKDYCKPLPQAANSNPFDDDINF